jgi:hypothetical protein
LDFVFVVVVVVFVFEFDLDLDLEFSSRLGLLITSLESLGLDLVSMLGHITFLRLINRIPTVVCAAGCHLWAKIEESEMVYFKIGV